MIRYESGVRCSHGVHVPKFCTRCAEHNGLALKGFHKPRRPRPQKGDGIGIPDEMLYLMSGETRSRLMMYRAGLITEADCPEVSA